MSTLVNARYKQHRGTEGSIPALLEGELYLCTDKNRTYKGTSSGNVLIGDKDQQDTNTANIAKFGNKNYAINGNFDIWQRGTSVINPTMYSYLADRFEIGYSLTGTPPTTLTHSKQTFTSGEVPNATNYYRLTSDSLGVLNSSDAYGLVYNIENGTRKLCGAGKKVTISFWAKSSITNKKLGVFATQLYGSGGTPTTAEVINGQFFTLTSSWQKFNITLTANTLLGKTFGTNNDDTFKVRFNYAYGVTSATSVGDTVGELFGNGTIDIAQVKIEAGDMVTPFVPLLPSEELLNCQRYYEKSYDSTINGNGAISSIAATGYVGQGFRFKQNKRIAPTMTITSPSGSASKAWNTSDTDTSFTVDALDVGISGVRYLHSSNGFTASNQYYVHFTADAEIY